MRRLVLHLAIFSTACASAPRPALLNEVDAVRASSSAAESRKLAPQADAKAEKLRNDAESAWPKGQTATAEIMAERALVAYADARELARIVRAEQQLVTAKAELHQAELALQKLEAQQKSAAAEAANVEAQLRVEREAEPITDPSLAGPDREQARSVASKTALSQARLLCVAAKLLRGPAPTEAQVENAITAVDDLETKLSDKKSNRPAPIREAIVARSRCQQLLTELRRPAISANPTSELADQLFVELARAGFSPSRDDRGIVVTFTKAFAGNGIDPQVSSKLAEFARMAQRHGESPVIVVAHSSKGDPTQGDRKRAEAAAAELKRVGLNQLEAQAVGGRLPIARASDLGAHRSNERLELVLVTRL